MKETEIAEILKAKREEAGMSIADVATKLNLSSDSIHKLEEGLHEKLPGRVFVRGYLRNYAKLLKINIAELFEEQEPVVVESGDDIGYVQNETFLSKTRVWGTVIILAFSIFAVYAWWVESQPPPIFVTPDVMTPQESEDRMPNYEEEPYTPPAADDEPPTNTWESSGEDTEEDAGTGAGIETDTGESTSMDDAAEMETPAESTTAFDVFVEVRLETGRFESWVNVVDADGDVLIERLMQPFSTARAYGTPPFNFRIGVVRDVSLTINDEFYPFAEHEVRGMAVFTAP